MNETILKVVTVFVFMAFLSGCTARVIDTKLTPQLMENGQIVYMYADLANFAQPDNDPSAEKNRIRDLTEWVTEAELCQNGFEIIKRQPIVTRSWANAKRIYYFIKCK